MILVTGASGHVGRRVATLLTAADVSLRLMVRDAAKAPALPGSQIVRADYGDPVSLDKAFQGIDKAFVVSGSERAGERALLHRNVFEAASRAGIAHLVYLSFQGAAPGSKFSASRDHYQSEQFLKQTGLSFTILRDSFYIDLIPELFGSDRLIRGPAGNGRVAWVARDDVAEAVAAVLRDPARFKGTYDLTGPEALTLSETAEHLTSLTGRNFGYRDESISEGRKWRSGLGVPDWMVDGWLGSYEAIAAGELAPVSDGVTHITGRAPVGLDVYFRRWSELSNAIGR